MKSYFLSHTSSLFTPQTAEAGGNILVYSDSLWSDGQDGPADRFFPHLTTFIMPSSSGGHAAADTDASPKCRHTGAGPPNRYKITA